jgi:CRISPR/Cas system CMR subunit Cmr4 (Cas7 group RAMP superfamily)
MNSEFTLTFELHSYWHIGNGKAAGAYADALVRKDQGLPFIPGKSINGLLRDAFTVADENDWFDEYQTATELSLTDLLFGAGGVQGHKAQGLLQLSNASLSAAEAHYFNANPQAKSRLYKVLTTTAINEHGVALDGSLRGIEVAVPMVLSAALTLNQSHPNYQASETRLSGRFDTWLSQTLSLITVLGASRHRGLGKVTINSSVVGAN